MGADDKPKVVYWHRELPPLDAELVAPHTVEATSSRVPGTIAHRDELWDQCYRDMMARAESRLVQEVTRLGGHFAHVHDEAIEPKHDEAAGEAWLHGRFSYMLYRRSAHDRTGPIRALLGIAALAVALGCSSLAPFPVSGEPGVLARVSGDWRGEYIGDPDHGRSGTIAFKLVAGEGHAHGTVVMIPAGSETLRHHALAIRFVHAARDILRGELEPYWDPDRRTQASATFRGFLGNGTIEGTFTVAYADGSHETGGWWTVSRAGRR